MLHLEVWMNIMLQGMVNVPIFAGMSSIIFGCRNKIGGMGSIIFGGID